MTQVLSEVEPGGGGTRAANAISPTVLPYAAPAVKNNPGVALAMAGLGCGAGFLGLVVLAGVVHPQIETPLLGMIIATPLAALVLGSLSGMRARKAGRKEPSNGRAAVWIGGIELVLVVAFGLMSVSMCRAREPANRAKCSNNLRQVGLALLMYANNHDGRFPDTLNVLLTLDPGDYGVTSDIFTCPSSTDERATGQTPAETARNLTAEPGHLSYVYVGAGLTNATATADRIVAYDNQHNHNDEGINVLFGDAHVEFLDRKQAQRAIAKPGPPSSAPAKPDTR